jgi:hygromycin-B 7''-O-kinase
MQPDRPSRPAPDRADEPEEWGGPAIVTGGWEQQALLEADPHAFVGRLLGTLGLPATPLVPAADGWSSSVWLAPAHAVRLGSGRFRDAYAHEAAVLRLLPPAVPHAPVVAHGRVGRREWLVQERIAGIPLSHAWSGMRRGQRRTATEELGAILRALHAVPLPAGFTNPWLDDSLAVGGPVRDAYHAPPTRYRLLLDAAAAVPGVDRRMLDDVGALIAGRLDAFTGDSAMLVHGDLHFANLMWDGERLAAVLDFEGARPAAPDQELDTLLRFTREPDLYRGRDGAPGPARQDLAAFADWLAGDHPALFAHPRLEERLLVYEALWHLVQLLHFPPGTGFPDPWGHLTDLVGRSR